MLGPLDTGPMAGDRCTRCGILIIEDPEVTHAEDGTLIALCPRCADESEAARAPEAPLSSAENHVSVGRARRLILDSLDQHTKERERLEYIGAVVDELAAELTGAQARVLEAEERIRALEAEVGHTRNLLRHAEELLVVTPTGPGQAAEEHVAPHILEHPPQLAASSANLTPADVRSAQKAFNESRFVEKTRSVRRGLGKPIVNLAAVAGSERKTLLTIAWDIVWYQYLIDLSDEPGLEVSLFGEGMELSELSDNLRRSNAIIDDQGRLDASELEFSLEPDHPAHAAQEDEQDEREIEDATEEIWDRTSMPEFRWDD